MERFVIDRPRENFLVVKEMHFLPVRQLDLRVFFQEMVQRRRARFLRTRNNEIEPLNLSPSKSKHDNSPALQRWVPSCK